MAGVRITVEAQGLAEAIARLQSFSEAQARFDLLDDVGAVAESGARRRIGEEKRGPDGVAWPAWSDRYAARRPAGRDLLQDEGFLLDSLASVVDFRGESVAVGSNLVYAAIHQLGGGGLAEGARGRNIPARPYLGLSDQDESDITDVIAGWVAGRLAR